MKAYIITRKDEPTVENCIGGSFFKSKKTAKKALKFISNSIEYKKEPTIIEVEITPVVNWLED